MSSTRKSIAYLIDPNHPVISALGNTFGGFLPGRKTAIKGIKPKIKQPVAIDKHGLTPRCDVVDEKLCDDVVQYLAPTLERHKGCTLIDINPGACVWSRKLHDFLQPKHHLLMEPDERYLEPFIQPLLHKPGSRYLYRCVAGMHPKNLFRNFSDIVKDKAVDFEPFLQHGDTKRTALNIDILVTGNLTRRFADFDRINNSVTPAALSLQHMSWTTLLNQVFHRNGPVRQLWWYPEVHKHTAIPRRPTQKSSFNVGLHLGADITEVAGTQLSQASARLGAATEEHPNGVFYAEMPQVFARENVRQVLSKMNAAGMTVPAGCETLSAVIPDAKEDGHELKSPLIIRHKTVEELLLELDKVKKRYAHVAEAAKESKRWSKLNHEGPTAPLSELQTTLEYPQCAYIVSLFPPIAKYRRGTKQTGAIFRLTQLMELQLRIINLEAHVKHFEDQNLDVTDITAKVIALDKEVRNMLVERTMGPTIGIWLDNLIMDQLMFFSNPPNLAFDRRAYEPLKISKESFWPPVEICLLDVVPTGRDMTVPDVADKFESTKTTQELLKYVFANKKSTLAQALDKIAPNAAQDLMPAVKSLADPRKGGRLNVEVVKVRMLSEGMVEELVKAWFEWPFRPSSWELALVAGGPGESTAGEEMLSLEVGERLESSE